MGLGCGVRSAVGLPDKSFKRECQETYLAVGSVPTLFLSRHSAQSFERARAIDEGSSSGSHCFVSSLETVRFFFPPVVPFHRCDGAMRFLKLNKRNGYPPS
jgi:hypothetical protein